MWAQRQLEGKNQYFTVLFCNINSAALESAKCFDRWHLGLFLLEIWQKFGLLPIDETRDISITRHGKDRLKETWAIHIPL